MTNLYEVEFFVNGEKDSIEVPAISKAQAIAMARPLITKIGGRIIQATKSTTEYPHELLN